MEIQLKHSSDLKWFSPDSNSKWRRIQDSLESADWRHRPIVALFQEEQKALTGCSRDPEKSWTSQSWKKEISPIIMLWNIHFCPEVCWQPHFQGKKKKVLLHKETHPLNLMPSPVLRTQLKSSHKPSESNNHLILLYSLTSAFGAILCGKAGAESYRNAVLGEISRE